MKTMFNLAESKVACGIHAATIVSYLIGEGHLNGTCAGRLRHIGYQTLALLTSFYEVS